MGDASERLRLTSPSSISLTTKGTRGLKRKQDSSAGKRRGPIRKSNRLAGIHVEASVVGGESFQERILKEEKEERKIQSGVDLSLKDAINGVDAKWANENSLESASILVGDLVRISK